VGHECLTTIILLIPEGIVENRTEVHTARASHLYGVIAW
jgi:hypothetical protein